MEPRGEHSERNLASEALAPASGQLNDCWNKIGVMGDGSCGELARMVHCRNCPVYSAAGAQLLDRPMPADYRREWTEHFSRAKAQAVPGKISVVIFRIETEWLALPTVVFQEVLERRLIHSLPHRRGGLVLGLLNMRGELQICVSLAKLLGVPECEPAPKAGVPAAPPKHVHERLMVATWRGTILIFPVEEIHGIERYHPDELKNVPATAATAKPGFTLGLLALDGRMVGCLDAETVFSTLNRSLT